MGIIMVYFLNKFQMRYWMRNCVTQKRKRKMPEKKTWSSVLWGASSSRVLSRIPVVLNNAVPLLLSVPALPSSPCLCCSSVVYCAVKRTAPTAGRMRRGKSESKWGMWRNRKIRFKTFIKGSSPKRLQYMKSQKGEKTL